MWNDQAPFLEDPAVSKVAGKIGYSLIPSNSPASFSQLEGLTYLIPTESKHPREAYRFIEWAMSAQVQVQQTLHGSSSVSKSTYNNPAIIALPYTSTFVASVPVAKPKPTIPESAEMTESMEHYLAEIVSGRTSAQAGLDRLALEFQGILGNKARLRHPVSRHPALQRRCWELASRLRYPLGRPRINAISDLSEPGPRRPSGAAALLWPIIPPEMPG